MPLPLLKIIMLAILSLFLNNPEYFYFAEDITRLSDFSLKRVYSILAELVSEGIIIKHHSIYFFNHHCILNRIFYTNILPFLKKTSKTKTTLYIIQYLLYQPSVEHTIGSLKILFKRSKKELEIILNELIDYKILVKTRKNCYRLNQDIIKKLANKSNMIVMSKESFE